MHGVWRGGRARYNQRVLGKETTDKGHVPGGDLHAWHVNKTGHSQGG